MAARSEQPPKTMAQVSKEGHDLCAGLSRLYTKGSKAFYGGFPALWPAMKTVYNLRRKHEAAQKLALPLHPLDELLDLWKNRTRHDDGTWSVDWHTLGKILGVKPAPVKGKKDDAQREDGEEDGLVAPSGKQHGPERSKEEGKAKNVEKGKGKAKEVAKEKTAEVKERPRPNPIGRKVNEAKATPATKPAATTKPPKPAPKKSKPADDDESEVEVVEPPPPKKSRVAPPVAPPARTPKPQGKAVAVVITRTKTTPAGAPKDTKGKYKSKATVGSVTDGEEEEVPLSKSMAKSKGGNKRVVPEEEEEGGGDSVEPEEDGDLYNGEASGGEEEGDDNDEEFEDDDPTAPPLLRAKARKAKTIALSQRCFRVFGRCAPCTKLNIPCVFSWKRFGRISHNAKVGCDHCHELHKGCENPTPGFLGLDSDLGEYERLAFPPNHDGTIPGGESDDEEGVKTIGDLLTTMLREQRSVGDRLQTLEDRVAEVGTGVETSPQHASGLTTAIEDMGKKLRDMEKERRAETLRREGARAQTEGTIAAAIAGLTAKVEALERNVSTPSEPSITAALQEILQKLGKSQERQSPAATPSPRIPVGDLTDDELEPTNVHLSPIPEVSETANSQQLTEDTTAAIDEEDNDDGLEPRMPLNEDDGEEGDQEPEGDNGKEDVGGEGEHGNSSAKGRDTEEGSPTEDGETVSPAAMDVDKEPPTANAPTAHVVKEIGQGEGDEEAVDTRESASRGASGSSGRPRRTRSMSRTRGAPPAGDQPSVKPKSAAAAVLKRKAATSPEREASKSSDGNVKKAKTTKKTKP